MKRLMLKMPFDHDSGKLTQVKESESFKREDLMLLYGGRVWLLISLGSVALGLLVGGLAECAACYRGGWLDSVIMRGSDILLAFPGFVMAAAVMAVLGLGVVNVILALALCSLPTFAALTRNMTLSLREQDYVVAARTIGARSAHYAPSHFAQPASTNLRVSTFAGRMQPISCMP